MNLREVQLSSRSVIPVALALPINRGPVDVREYETHQRECREANAEHSLSTHGSLPIL